MLGAGAGKAHGRAAEVAAHLLQRWRHHEALLHWRTTGSKEQAGRPPRRRLASSPGSRDPAALAFDVAVEVVGTGEALVAELALVGPDARMDAHVVLQVIVVHKFSIAVDAQVRPLPRVLPHVDFELVLPAKEKVLGQAGRDCGWDCSLDQERERRWEGGELILGLPPMYGCSRRVAFASASSFPGRQHLNIAHAQPSTSGVCSPSQSSNQPKSEEKTLQYKTKKTYGNI